MDEITAAIVQAFRDAAARTHDERDAWLLTDGGQKVLASGPEDGDGQ